MQAERSRRETIYSRMKISSIYGLFPIVSSLAQAIKCSSRIPSQNLVVKKPRVFSTIFSSGDAFPVPRCSPEEVRDTDALPVISGGNPAPLLDSQVFIFCTNPEEEDFDFACIGDDRMFRRRSIPHERRTLKAARPKTWCAPSSLPPAATRTPDITRRALSGLGPGWAPAGQMYEGGVCPLVVGATEYDRFSRSPDPPRVYKGVAARRWNGIDTRASNKWGDHPPAGYI